jgi:hypothetical protein
MARKGPIIRGYLRYLRDNYNMCFWWMNISNEKTMRVYKNWRTIRNILATQNMETIRTLVNRKPDKV